MSNSSVFDWRENNGDPSVFANDPRFARRTSKHSGAPPPLMKGSEQHPNKRQPKPAQGAAK